MRESPDPVQAAIAHAFYARLQSDRETGALVALSDYQRRFPGYEGLVAKLHHGVVAESTNEHDDSDPADTAFGSYVLERSLGRGAQGEVYLAVDRRLRRRVALKVLRVWGSDAHDRLARFQREAQVASRLAHPGICAVYESGVVGNVPYIAMQYVEGESLGRLLEGSGGPRPDRAAILARLEIVERLARAVHVAHEAGIIHRDLKPGNVMVGADGQPVVLDFGLACDLEEGNAPLTRTGDSFGTPAYMAPEQIDGTLGRPDRRCDVWALGVILFEATVGERPFSAVTREGLHRAVLASPHPAPRSVNHMVSKDLATVVGMALTKERNGRYQTCLDLAEELARVRHGKPIMARPLGLIPRAARWVRRNPAHAAASALAFATIALGSYLAARAPELRAHREATCRQAVERELEIAFEEAATGGRPDVGIDALRRAAALAPDLPDPLAGLGLMFLQAGRPLDAIGVLRDRADLVALHPALRWIEAEALRETGREAEAQRLEQSLGDPQEPLALFVIGTREILRGLRGDDPAFARAVSSLARCVQRASPARALYHFGLAQAAGLAGDGAAARDAAAAIRVLWAGSALGISYAGAALAAVSPEEATELLEAAARLRPGSTTVLTHLARARVAADDADGVRAAASRILRLDPNSAYGWFYEGVGQGMRGAATQAIAALERSLELRPDEPMTVYNLAKALALAGRVDEAASCYREVLRRQARFPNAWTNLGLLLERRDPMQAVPVLEEAVRAVPDNVKARLALARTLRGVGRMDDAERELRNLHARWPDNVDVLVDYGAFLADVGNHLPHAEILFARAGALMPEAPIPVFNLARVLERQREPARALSAYSRYCELALGAPPTMEQIAAFGDARGLAEALAALGRLESGAMSVEHAPEPGKLACLARGRGFVVLAARLCLVALEAEALSDDARRELELELVRSAARAGSGLGRDAACLSDDDRRQWLARAFDGLDSGLEAARSAVRDGSMAQEKLRSQASARRADPELGVLRDQDALHRLDPRLAARSRALWASMEEAARSSSRPQ